MPTTSNRPTSTNNLGPWNLELEPCNLDLEPSPSRLREPRSGEAIGHSTDQLPRAPKPQARRTSTRRLREPRSGEAIGHSINNDPRSGEAIVHSTDQRPRAPQLQAQHTSAFNLQPLAFCLSLSLLLLPSLTKAQLPNETIYDEKTGDHISADGFTFDNPEHPFSLLSVSPPWCGYGYVSDKATFRITFNNGDDDDMGAAPFTASYDFMLVALDQYHNTIFEEEHHLDIDQTRPEAVFQRVLDNQFVNISELRVDPVTVSFNTTEIAAERVHASYTLNIHRRIAPPPSGPHTTSPNPVSTASNQVRFGWNWFSMFELACTHKFPRYQLQVLRLFERGSGGAVDHLVQAQVDWSQAATFDLETEAEYIDLTLAEGTGFYAWRVRPIVNWYSDEPQDPRNWGPWSNVGAATQGATLSNITASGTPQAGAAMATRNSSAGAHIFYYQQFNEDRNWIYSRTFTEGSATEDVPLRLAEHITYATTLQQVQQEQACLHEDGNTLATQTVLDLSGRPAIKTLPTPVQGQPSVGFVPNLMEPASDAHNFAATDFDNITPPTFTDPVLAHDYGTDPFGYYTDGNPNTEVPDAHGFPYVHTTFHADGRPKQVSAPGAEFALTNVAHPDAPTPANYHTPTTSYAGVTATELTRVFGDQAYDPATVHQVITTDANGTTSTSYQDKEGHVLATSLLYTGVENDLEPLPAAASSAYPVIGSIGGDAPAGTSSIEAQAVFTVDPPGQTVEFKYIIDPTTIHDECGTYCATCDATIELFLTEQDDPTATNLIDDDDHYPAANAHRTTTINGSHSDEGTCSTEEQGFSFSMDLPAGNYTLTRRLTTNNPDPITLATPSTVDDITLEQAHENEVQAQYEDLLNTQLSATIAALESDDLDAAFATGTIVDIGLLNGGPSELYVSWPIGCTTLTMPVETCPECNDGSAHLLDLFIAQYNEMVDRRNTDDDTGNDLTEITTYADALAHIQLHGNTYTLTLFNSLMENLRAFEIGEDPAYTCDQIANCWLGACTAYLAAWENGATTIDLDDVDFSELPNGNSGVSGTVHVELMDIFLNCLGRHITYAATSTEDYLTHAFQATPYDPEASGSESCADAVQEAYTAAGITTTDWSTPMTLTTANGDVTTTGWAVFDGCMNGSDGITFTGGAPNTTELEEMLEAQLHGLQDQCYQACYAKRDQFRDQIQAIYGLDPTNTSDAEEIGCLMNAVLADCYADCAQPTVQHNVSGDPTGIGTPEQLTRVQDIIAGHATLHVASGSPPTCEEGFGPVPITGVQTPLPAMLPDATATVEQLNNALNGLAPFILQHDFHDYANWHLIADEAGGDVLSWDHPEICLTIRARIGQVADPSPARNDCTDGYSAGAFASASSVRCGPLNAYNIYQFEVAINGHTVFGARFGTTFTNLYTLSTALAGGQAFTTTLGQFAIAGTGIDFVTASSTAWPTTGLPLYVPSGTTPVISVELLDGNTNAGSVATTHTIGDLRTNYGCTATSSCDKPLCIQWATGLDVDNDDADHIDLDPCAHVIATNYLEAIHQRMADVIAAAREHIRSEYHAHCADPAGISDDLSYSYSRGQYQYTLYYYDRAGNLINTVAPAQVRTMEVVDPSDDPETWRTLPLDQHQRTTYVHNSLGQVVQQTTPNGGTTSIYLDLLGRPRLAQDAQQRIDKVFTYTLYDALGRVTETGQATLPGTHTTIEEWLGADYSAIAQQLSDHPTWPTSLRAYRTITTYTTATPIGLIPDGRMQRFLQNRVSYATTDEDGDLSSTGDQVTTYYSYDPHGNVEWLAQSIPVLGFSFVDYDYDLISGRVRQVRYNAGHADQFFQRYTYDADGRIRSARTSPDGVLWDHDATYAYFKHGPLQRTVVGEDQVQGTDHTYTLQGWLKGINDPLLAGNDVGQDGMGTSTTARDAFGMVLGYYDGDFTRTGSNFTAHGNVRDGRELFNGNISGWGFNAQKALDEGGAQPAFTDPLAFAYQYDELNRLRAADSKPFAVDPLHPLDPAHWLHTTDNWHSDQTYDPNGNILTALRKGSTGNVVDDMTYDMPSALTTTVPPDQLPHLHESTNGEGDDLQDGHTYLYYANGELKSDISASSSVKAQRWDPYGKVRHVLIGDDQHLRFLYDATGQRVAKANMVHGSTTDHSFMQSLQEGDVYTYYVRDAQGNILATYDRTFHPDDIIEDGLDDIIALSEEDIYGSARLGLRKGAALDPVFQQTWVDGEVVSPDHGDVLPLSEVDHLQLAQLDAFWGSLKEHHTIPTDPDTIQANDLFKDAAACANLYRAEDLRGNTLFTARGFEDINTDSTVFILTDRTLTPMLNSDGILADWRTGTLSAMVPEEVGASKDKDNPLNYLFTIGEDGHPYLSTIDMDATTTTLGEVVEPKNVDLEADPDWKYTGAMAVLDDHTGLGHSWVYFKRIQADTTQIVGVDLYEWTYGKHPEDAFHLLAAVHGVHDQRFAYDEMQLSPDGHYLACVIRTSTGDIFADHSILRFALSPARNALTKLNEAKIAGTNISSIDFSPAGNYIYFVGTNEDGTAAYRIHADANSGTTPQLVREQAGDVRRTSHHGMLITDLKVITHVTDPDATTLSQTEVAHHGAWNSGIYFLPNVALQPLRIRKELTVEGTFARTVDDKRYELTDHLGTVRVVVSDWKQSEYVAEEDEATNFYAKVLSRADYYPFGSLLPGRTYDATTDAYRFGFNGKESDPEIHSAEGTSLDFGARMYDPRVGRWLSMDHLAGKYPYESPYSFAGNSPNYIIDIGGDSLYILMHISGYDHGDDMFKAAAYTRKYDIEHSQGFDPARDKVVVIEVQDVATIRDKVESAVAENKAAYGGTVEFDLWSHAGTDGPAGSAIASCNRLDDGSGQHQMNMTGWCLTEFNWSSSSNNRANFFGCRTGLVPNGASESFAQKVSQLYAFQGATVSGQLNFAFPSQYTDCRDPSFSQMMGDFLPIERTSKTLCGTESYLCRTYMVAGGKAQLATERSALGSIEGEKMSAYQNGRFVSDHFQPGHKH